VTALRHAIGHVADWMKREQRPVDWPLQPGRAFLSPQPLGVVGIVSPWNYPIFLMMSPLASALAAGNRVMLKPSELTPRTGELLRKLIAGEFAEDHVAVLLGGPKVGEAFTKLPFDHLLFTGSTAVGRHVMRAASENLTPVTLELGGKSPALIADDANLSSAAEDIVYGKLLNAGQTCIAPDYLLVSRSKVGALVQALKAAATKYYPDGGSSPDYTGIIDDRHFDRLQNYVREAIEAGVSMEKLFEGGSGRRMSPVVLIDPPNGLHVMQEEIFGPVLPIISVESMDAAVDYVNARPRPLVLYLFSKSRSVIDDVLRRTVSGGVCVNDTLVHVCVDGLPFGGVGASGMGSYHGKEGFETFSRNKPVFARRMPGLGRSLRPPYGKIHEWMRRILIG
ncbi:MAG: coniferyl aldehyde dehydrogenase, partial [Bryobacteraceae bacterium]